MINMEEGDIVTDVPAFASTKSVVMDGVDEFVLVGNVSALQFERTDAFSVSIWFKTVSIATQALFAKREQQWTWPYTYRGYSLTIRESDIKFDACHETGSSALEVRALKPAGQYMDGNWHHLVVTYDGSSSTNGVQIYVDDVPLSMTPYVDTLDDTILNSQPFLWGARGGGPSSTIAKFVDGNLDEGSVWSKKLSQAEASELYNGGHPESCIAHSAAANLVHWLRLGDSDSYPVITDHSFNNNHGTMTNADLSDIVADAP
jgi:hypothetical protein